MAVTQAQPEADVTYREVLFHSISAHTNHNWCVLYWQEPKGRVLITSDLGDWSFAWHHIGSRSLAAFLYQLDSDYIGRKMLENRYEEYDPQATLQAIKETIIEQRREKRITKSQAREFYNSLDDLSCETAFSIWSLSTDLEDGHDCMRYRPHSPWTHFWARLWLPYIRPRLKEFIDGQVQSGSTQEG